ncbi:MAG: homoserine O-acetyltransferase [Actinomycetota bacterium]|nr:homoserine O-acetyltransferase [Actinomycetota bacterium]
MAIVHPGAPETGPDAHPFGPDAATHGSPGARASADDPGGDSDHLDDGHGHLDGAAASVDGHRTGRRVHVERYADGDVVGSGADAVGPVGTPPAPPSAPAWSWTPPAAPAGLPASGAWQPGDPIGNRRFLQLTERGFALEGGGSLRDVVVAYETWGTLADDASNAVLVCHALTGDAHAAGPMTPAHASPGWWDDFIGPGRPIDTDRYFVVCVNVLGGCQGSTGPSSVDPATGERYGPRFPVVSVRDMVRCQSRLAEHLGIGRWLSVVGGSMGGMQVLEWAVMMPDRVRSIAAMATATAASAQQIAWSEVGRLAICGDPGWRDGDYYDAAPGEGPHRGLALARRIGQIHYRSEQEFAGRFGRESVEPLGRFAPWQRFQVESYLDHHGWKLTRRFDANSYLVLNKAMDLHDIGRGRGGARAALARVRVPVMTVAVDSDFLYPPYQQYEIRDTLRSLGVPVTHLDVHSDAGHDGFLVEDDAIGPHLASFLERAAEADGGDGTGRHT